MLPEIDLTALDPAVVAAVDAARTHVLRSPQSAAAWGRLGMVLAAHDLYAPALICLAEAERLDPHEPRWPHLQGLTLSMGDPRAAVPKFRQAVARCSDAPEAPRFWLAQLLLAQGQFDEAEEHYQRLLRRTAIRPWADLGLGRLACQRGRWQESLAPLERAAADRRTCKAARTLLAEVHRRQGDEAAADRELRRAEKAPPEGLWPDPFAAEVSRLRVGEHARLDFAFQLLGQQRYAEAADLLQPLALDYPESGPALLLLGQALLGRGDYSAAVPVLREAVRRVPGSAEGQLYLGRALLQQGEPGAAAAALRQAVALKPGYAQAAYYLGLCLLRQGDEPGAIAAAQEALRGRPDDARARELLLRLLLKRFVVPLRP
jgi:tetratricopeptide (TPR) repeat protein